MPLPTLTVTNIKPLIKVCDNQTDLESINSGAVTFFNDGSVDQMWALSHWFRAINLKYRGFTGIYLFPNCDAGGRPLTPADVEVDVANFLLEDGFDILLEDGEFLMLE